MAINVTVDGLDNEIEVKMSSDSRTIPVSTDEIFVIEDHTTLRNRDAENQHPISAISGLETRLGTFALASDLESHTQDDDIHVTSADKTAWDGKQDELIAGTNITIVDNVISATGGGGGGAVDSVNGKTGTVVLDAEDVGALPDTTAIPSKTSDLTNDSGFITSADVPTELADLSDDATHRLVTDTEKSTWSGKQDAISDLASIRTNAGKGATAIQANDYAGGSTAGVVKTTSTYGVGTNGSGYLYGLIIPAAQYELTNSNAIVSKGTLDNQHFVSDGSYVHTDNNYTTADKTKLSGIEAGAEVNDPNTVIDAGYVHTDNNYTNADKTLVGTAVQPTDLATVATSGSYNDLSNKPTIPAAQVQADWDEADTTSKAFIKNKPTIPEGSVLYHSLGQNVDGAIDQKIVTDALGDKADSVDVPTALSQLSADSTHRLVTDTEKSTWNNKSDFSGAYADLSGKPTIPTQLSQLSGDTTHRVVTDTEKSTWNAKGSYSKPSGGIPKSDLASAVQTSLGLADTALQSFTESDPVFVASPAHGITSANISSWNGKAETSDIPTALSQLSADSTHRLVTDTEKSTWNSKGTYSKPSGGIPKTDLASAVQTSLGKADTALQSLPSHDHSEIKSGTTKFEIVTGGFNIVINGVTVGTIRRT